MAKEKTEEKLTAEFYRHYDLLMAALHHIPKAISGSEITADLDYAQKKLTKMIRIKEQL